MIWKATIQYVNEFLEGRSIQKLKFSRGLITFVITGFLCLMNYNQVYSQTYIPILDPPGRFEIDGNLIAKDVQDGIDWAPYWNGNEYVLSDNNYIFFEEEKIIDGQLKTVTTAVDPNTSVFVVDPLESSNDDVFAGGNKYFEDPTEWKTKMAGASPGKGDMNTAFYHISRNTNGDQWLFVGSDRLKNNGTSYIDFEFFQGGVFHDPSNNTFTTTNTNGQGRSEGDFLISVKYSNGGSNATVQFFIWENGEYVEYTSSIGANDAFAAGNTTLIKRPFTGNNAAAYDAYLFVEAGLNMTKIFNGVSNQFCDGIELESLLVKTKTSTSDTATLIDFIGPVPVDIFFGAARISYDPNPVCENYGSTYDPEIEGVATGTFTAPSGLVFVDQDTEGKSKSGIIDIAASNPGSYEITYTFDSYGCKDLTSTYTVEISPLPSAPETTSGYGNGDFKQCDTGQILNANNAIKAVSGVDIIWYTSEGGTETTNSPTLSEPGTISYWAQAVSQNGGCESEDRTEVILQLKEKPVAHEDEDSTNEDTPVTINVIANDTDFENDALILTAVTDPANGKTEIINNQVKYTPNDDYHGVDTFVYTVSDGDCGTDTALVTVTVKSINDAPVASPDAINVNEGGVATKLVTDENNVLANDDDVDGDLLTVELVDNVDNGTLTLNSNGTFTYTHDGSETISDSFSYKAWDGEYYSNIVEVSISINPVNDPPVANDDSFSGNEDSNIAIALSGSDIDGNIVSFIIKTLPLNGTLKLNNTTVNAGQSIPFASASSLIFTPEPDYNGPSSFTYTAKDDDNLEGDPATISITVLPLNDAPVITNNNSLPDNSTNYIENGGSPVIDWNATDADGETENGGGLTYSLAGIDAGLFSLNTGTGVLTFNSPPDFENPVDFDGDNVYLVEVTVKDEAGETDIQSLEITITNEIESADFNIEPIANVFLDENTDYTSVTPEVTGDPSGDVEFSISGGADAGLFSINTTSGVVTMDGKDYEDPQDADGNNDYEITIRATDEDGNIDEESWIVFINNLNDNQPVAVADEIEVDEGQSTSVLKSGSNSVLTNDTDADNNPLTAILVTDVQHGILSLNPDGTFTYKHLGEEEFTDSFTYKVNDGIYDSEPVTVTITIRPVNDAPKAVADEIEVDEGGSTSTLVSTETSVLKNDTDPDSNNLTAVLVSGVTNGTLTLNPDGTFLYTHDGSETTSDSFEYKANDGEKDSNTVTVTITINPVNDAPKAVNDAILVNEGATATSLVSDKSSVLFNDTDAENNSLTAILVKDVDHGTLILNSDGTFSYTHDGSETLTDSFTYKANDGNLDSNVATVSITIKPVNDVPVANDDFIELNEGATITKLKNGNLSVLDNDTDGDGDDLTVILVEDVQNGILILNDDGTFSYEHNGSETTSDKFTYKVNDAKADSNIATVWITIIEVNDPPVAADKFFSGDEDTNIDILLSATDIDGNIQYYTIETIPGTGKLTLNNTLVIEGQQIQPADAGNLVYEPKPDYNGSTSFTYSATDDDDLKGNIATVSITVDPVNDAPVITNNSSLPTNSTTYIENGTSAVIDWNATDVDGETENGGGLTYSLAGEDAALFNLDPDTGVLTFINSPDFEDPLDLDGDNVYKVEVTVIDEALETDTQSLDITVENEVESAVFNIDPIDDVSIAENTAYTSVQPSITGTPIGTITYSISGGTDADLFTIDPETGIVQMEPKDYETPIDSDQNNTYQVTIKATDSDNNSDEETWVVSILNENDNTPVAFPDEIELPEGSFTSALVSGDNSVLDNDNDEDDDTLTADLVSNVSHGTLQLQADGTFTYTHNGSENFTDSFTYRAFDGENYSNTVTVSITITPVNDAPKAYDDAISVEEGENETILVSLENSVLDNDTDAENDNLTAILVKNVDHGTLTLNSDGTFSYTHDGSETSSDSFTYIANDGELDSEVATVNISIIAKNDAPVAFEDAIILNEGGTETQLVGGKFSVLDNDTDAENNPLTAILVTTVSHGSLTLFSDGTFIYTHDGSETQSDSFTYKANDGLLDSNETTVLITIQPVNDAPQAKDDTIETNEDTSVEIAVLENDTDAEDDELEIKEVSVPSHGFVVHDGTTITYTPDPDYHGEDSFTYTISDGNGGTDTAEVKVIVNPINDDPVAEDDVAVTLENTATEIPVLDNDTDIDGDPLTVSSVGTPANGIATTDGTTVTYTPKQNFTGEDTFTYTISDGKGGTDSAEITVFVSDQSGPEITCPESFEVENDEGDCGAIVVFTLPEFTDNSGSATIEQISGPESGTLFPVGVSTLVFKATDNSNNFTICTYDVTVVDKEAPVITECASDITVFSDEDLCSASEVFLGSLQVSDNCDSNLSITNNAPAVFPQGDTVVTWTVEDSAGNKSECLQTVSVKDNQAPNIIACAEDMNVTANADVCFATQVELGTVNAEDNCDEELTITNDAPVEFNIGVTKVTWTVTDKSGNSAQCIQTVTVTDDQAPEILSCAPDISVTADHDQCSASAVDLGTLSAKDNCEADLTITNDAPETFPVGNTEVTWTVTDAAGNSTTCVQLVTVTDDQAPEVETISNITVDSDPGTCGAVVTFNTVGATDNCELESVEISEGLSSGSEFPVGTTTVTYTVTDASGNTTTSTFTVTVEDTEDPVLTCPSDMTVTTVDGESFAMVEFNMATVTDNCGATVEQTSGPVSGSQFSIGSTTVSFTATDGAGNTITCSFTVTVTDGENPVLDCPEPIVQNVDEGLCGAIVEFSTPSGFDNSGEVTVEQTAGPASGELFELGTTTVTFTATDNTGNSVDCSFTVTILDNEAPVIEEVEDIVVNNDENTCGAIVSFNPPAATDNCEIESVTQTEGPSSGSEFPIGTTTVTFTAMDTSGNTSITSFTVTVEDTQSPSVECPADVTKIVEIGTTSVIVEYTAITVTDNCEGSTVELTTGIASGEEFPLGSTLVEYTITDASGNAITCSFTVIVEEEPLPDPPSTPTATVTTEATCTSPLGTITVETQEGLTYSIDGENYQESGVFADLEPGDYEITARDQFGQTSDPVIVTIEAPVADPIQTFAVDLCVDDGIFDLFELLTGEYDETGTWTDPDNTGALENSFIDPDLMAVGSYTFTYELEGNCPSSTEVSVLINDRCVVLPCEISDIRSSISKAVTPNGDNKNDFFLVDLTRECGFSYDLKIFNRWGAKVFDAKNYQNNWDGFSNTAITNSKQLPSGTYFYILEIRNSTFEPIQGYIYLGTK